MELKFQLNDKEKAFLKEVEKRSSEINNDVEKIVKEDSSNITLFYGEGVTEEDTKILLKKLEDKFPHQDISLQYSQGPH